MVIENVLIEVLRMCKIEELIMVLVVMYLEERVCLHTSKRCAGAFIEDWRTPGCQFGKLLLLC